MRRFFETPTLAAFLALNLILTFSSVPSAVAKTASSKTRAIKAERDRIKKLEKTLKKIVSEDSASDGFSMGPDEKKSSRWFLEKDHIVEVREKFMVDLGRMEMAFYFQDEKLIYAYSVEYTYNHPMAAESKDVGTFKVTTSENRYYFEGDKLIKWMVDKDEVPQSRSNFAAEQTRILTWAAKALEHAKKD